IPTRWVMQPLDKPDKETVLQIDSIEFDPPIADSVFTRANLKRRSK
ncbi:MAG: outer membrane lipoprotein-sorting protein, partial [Gammaproteobacteria bacterium]|nr:outer membrane lipoprotein-sorting protein [Gammaproteobacteria bacterium]